MRKKKRKIFLTAILIIITFIVLDSLQVIMFKNSPIIHVKEKLGDESYVDKGIILNTYYCVDDDTIDVTWKLKTSKFTCPLKKKENKRLSDTELADLALVYFLNNNKDAKEDIAYSVGVIDEIIDKYKDKDMVTIEIRHVNVGNNTLDARYFINYYTAIGYDDLGRDVDFNL